jgi:hypothetical protein
MTNERRPQGQGAANQRGTMMGNKDIAYIEKNRYTNKALGTASDLVDLVAVRQVVAHPACLPH